MSKIYLANSLIDTDVIADIYKLCFRDDLSGDSIRNILCRDQCFAFLGQEQADIGPVGFIICRVVAEESELLWLGVRPDKQRQGWARSLMSKAVEEAQSRGAETMVLEVAKNNKPACHLYESLGFKTVGNRSGYYAQCVVGVSDATIMRVRLVTLGTGSNLGY